MMNLLDPDFLHYLYQDTEFLTVITELKRLKTVIALLPSDVLLLNEALHLEHKAWRIYVDASDKISRELPSREMRGLAFKDGSLFHL